MILDDPLRDVLDSTAAKDSTPGGGAIAALAGAMAAALGSMSCRYTTGPKFEDRADEIDRLLGILEDARATIGDLAQKDIEAYGGYTAATGLPRSTDEEKAARRAAIQEALLGAMEVPLEIARQCAQLLERIDEAEPLVNPYLVSDVGCAAALAEAAFRAARFNVLVNLGSLKAAEPRARALEELASLDSRIRAASDRVLPAIESALAVEEEKTA